MSVNPYIITPNSVIVYVNQKQFNVNKSHPEFANVIAAIKEKRFEDLEDLVDKKKVVEKSSAGRLSVVGNEVLFNSAPVHNYVVEKIMEFIRDNLDFKPLLNFLDRLLLNPSKRAVDELYKFLEHKGFPIDEDGFFYGYKGVREDYKDVYTGTIDNSPGSKPVFDRNRVCDDKDIGCAAGLHVGTYEYASNWGPRVVIVKVDPANVVSIPVDCNFQKLRCCEYEVIEDCTGKFESPVIESKEQQLVLPFDDLDEDDYDLDLDEDWDDDEEDEDDDEEDEDDEDDEDDDEEDEDDEDDEDDDDFEKCGIPGCPFCSK